METGQRLINLPPPSTHSQQEFSPPSVHQSIEVMRRSASALQFPRGNRPFSHEPFVTTPSPSPIEPPVEPLMNRQQREKNLIQELIECDGLNNIVDLRGINEAAQQDQADPAQKLSTIGDEIVEKLVEWTKQLPFYSELPVHIHTQLLTKRWAELVLLSTIYYAADQLDAGHNSYHHGDKDGQREVPMEQDDQPQSSSEGPGDSGSPLDLTTSDQLSSESAAHNVDLLRRRLSSVMRREIPVEHVQREAGGLVDKFTQLLASFRKLRMTHESYVCLKAATLLNQGRVQLPRSHVLVIILLINFISQITCLRRSISSSESPSYSRSVHQGATDPSKPVRRSHSPNGHSHLATPIVRCGCFAA